MGYLKLPCYPIWAFYNRGSVSKWLIRCEQVITMTHAANPAQNHMIASDKAGTVRSLLRANKSRPRILNSILVRSKQSSTRSLDIVSEAEDARQTLSGVNMRTNGTRRLMVIGAGREYQTEPTPPSKQSVRFAALALDVDLGHWLPQTGY